MDGRATVTVGLALLVALGAAGPVLAQDPAPPAEEERARAMQEHVERANELMDRMHAASEKGHHLHREMGEHGHRMREQRHAEPEMMLHHERMRDMARDLGSAAANVAWATEEMRDLLMDMEDLEETGVEEEAERMLENLEEIAERIEDGLDTMERVRERMTEHMEGTRDEPYDH